jgi:choline dehydrogenase-like flavoprotein
MLFDARKADCQLTHATQFAVVGAGPAGMTIARELARTGPVLLIESGGLEACDGVQSLSEGESVGWDYSLTHSRARGFGGTSSLWAGWCAVFDPHDFEQRDWVERSGWPVDMDEIVPFYNRTAAILNLDRSDFDARSIAGAAAKLPFEEKVVTPSVWRFGTPIARFGQKFDEEFESSVAITTLLHANVVDIRLDRGCSRVVDLVVRTLDGRVGRVSADVVVLACGGIETPRMLLNADSQCAGGIGNSAGLVGRFFMEHPHEAVHSLELADAAWLEHSLRQTSIDGQQPFMLALGLTFEVQRDAGILNARAHVYRTPEMNEQEPARLGLFLEQSPNPLSRVTLSNSRDCLGLRRARLDWQFDALDWKTYETTCRLFESEVVRCGVGKILSVPKRDNDVYRRQLIPTNHHIGTTRMSTSDHVGVVDANCRVHGIENLYIAGSSVFPTSSWANPTFTLIALSLRLANHLGSLAGSSEKEDVDE